MGDQNVWVHNRCDRAQGFDNKIITNPKNQSMQIHLERGGGGKYNLHMHYDGRKYMYNGVDGFVGAGRINNDAFIKVGIEKAIIYLDKIGGSLE